MKKALFLIALIFVFLLLMAGCSDFTAPDGTVRITLPAEWKSWWEEAQACVNKPQKERYEDIKWYVTPGYIPFEGDSGAGFAHNQDVYISSYAIDYAFQVELKRVVVHELVHAIDHIGSDPHPYEPFHKCNLMSGQRYYP